MIRLYFKGCWLFDAIKAEKLCVCVCVCVCERERERERERQCRLCPSPRILVALMARQHLLPAALGRRTAANPTRTPAVYRDKSPLSLPLSPPSAILFCPTPYIVHLFHTL